MSVAKNVALVAVGAVGAVFAVNQLAKPAKTHGIAAAMRRQLDEYNMSVQPEQDPKYVSHTLEAEEEGKDVVTDKLNSDTIFDRTKILNDVKARKPWNMTYADKERVKRE